MKHKRGGGLNRRLNHPADPADRRSEGHHHPRPGRHASGPHGSGRGRLRPFDYGDLRLLALAMIKEQPQHGYELMKAIEERMGGSYSPSPGVIYPTLAWLEELGYASIEATDGIRKRYRITDEGEAFLAANREGVDALLSRLGAPGSGRPDGVPASVLRGMENLKLAVRLRLKRGGLDQAAADGIAAALDAAARTVERS